MPTIELTPHEQDGVTVLHGPTAPRCTGNTLVMGQNIRGVLQDMKAELPPQQFKWCNDERAGVLFSFHCFKALHDAAGSFERYVIWAYAINREHLSQDERKARRHCID